VVPAPGWLLRHVLLLLPVTTAVAHGADAPPPSPFDPAERLAAVRRLLREEGPASHRVAALAAPLESAGGLWALRWKVARVASALASGGALASGEFASLDTAPLGLPGLGPWLKLEASRPSVSALLSWAAAEPYEPFARDAATLAARLSQTTAEKRAARQILDKWEARGAPTTRETIDLALARARIAASAAEARRIYLALAAARPDVPEREPDLFDATDRKEFERAVRSGPELVRRAGPSLSRHATRRKPSPSFPVRRLRPTPAWMLPRSVSSPGMQPGRSVSFRQRPRPFSRPKRTRSAPAP